MSAESVHYSFSAGDLVRVNNNMWCIDSGASSHMVDNRSFFKSLQSHNDVIHIVDGAKMKVTGIGSGNVSCI